MEMHYTEKTVTLHRKYYTVIIPDNIDGFVNRVFCMDADRKALNAILLSFLMLLENRNLIIYFPLWNNELSEGIYFSEPTEHRYENFDVVFLSHTLQFKLHDWKELRNKLKKCEGMKQTKSVHLELADITIKNIYESYRKKNAYYKEVDLFDRYFRFDTHFFVCGPYSLAESYKRLREFLEDPLEEFLIERIAKKELKYAWLDWTYFLQRGDHRLKHDAEEGVEIGFYDRNIYKP